MFVNARAIPDSKTARSGPTLAPPSSLKPLIGVAIALVAVIVPLYTAKIFNQSSNTDFGVYYRAAIRAKLGQWDSLYSPQLDGVSPFRYAPWTLPFFRPFAELSRAQAHVAWFYLQLLFFGLGFHALWRLLRLLRRERAGKAWSTWATLLSALAVLRLCLDTFIIGQTSSLMFLGFAQAALASAQARPRAAALWVWIPASLKLGPAFLWGSLARLRPGRLPGAVLATALLTAAGIGASWIWLHGTGAFASLWRGWWGCVMQDGDYYDASHYGSQSLKSALLRAAKAGWISPARAEEAWIGISAAVCAAILALWIFRRPRGRWGRALFFALGLFPYFWFMPETFKYSLTGLAIPFSLLLAVPERGRLAGAALLAHGAAISVAGLDIIGSTLFFAFQNWSLPLISTALTGAAVARLAWRESKPRERKPSLLGPWPAAPVAQPTLKVSLLVPVPFERVSPVASDALAAMLDRLLASLKGAKGLPFEILLIPYGRTFSKEHPLHQACRSAAELHPETLLLPQSSLPERGAALREGFLASRGEWIAAAFCEQPVGPEFYLEAFQVLRDGRVELVRANRRMRDGRFLIPVRLLPSVHRRHGLALAWNRLLRGILPLDSTDTQSGTWAVSRRLARHFFAVQSQPGMGSELELALAARALQAKSRDLPVRVVLLEEKTSKRVFRESLELLRAAPKLRRRWISGCYQGRPLQARGLSADDWGLSPGVNEAILELAKAGALQRASLLTDGKYLKEGLKELKELEGLQLGLHFNLTYADPDPRLRHPNAWILRTLFPWSRLARGMRKQALGALEKQLEVLTDLDVPISYLDGHHHMHLLPGFLKEAAPLLRRHKIREVRLPLHWKMLFTPRWPLVVLSLLALPTFLKQGWKRRPFYYPSLGELADPAAFRARVARRPESEYITHPATRDDVAGLDVPDPYSSERILEYRSLRMLSAKFVEGPPA